jgi:hypothetical protein
LSGVGPLEEGEKLAKQLRSLYYVVKPFVPKAVLFSLRRRHAAWIRNKKRLEWPIKEGSDTPPPGWPGWPSKKQFALVLTHDVESENGLRNCELVVQIEKKRGFRSSFNFVPEGGYSVSTSLRQEMINQGFEVGVHDLHHDGKLFQSHQNFKGKAARINQYLKAWNARGFRAGFMLHRLDWLDQLDILYDASTFDTDPFEPQPEGMSRIFPFWVPGRDGRGYVELPYTLVQDSTLFLYLGERTIDIWKQKLDWLANHHGMVLVITHPDYMSFGPNCSRKGFYPSRHYEELLNYVAEAYKGCYWHALPAEVAMYYRNYTTTEHQSAIEH